MFMRTLPSLLLTTGLALAMDSALAQPHASRQAAVMDALKIDKAMIGGMPMGGPVALEMYRQSPEHVNGMMLIDTTAKPAIPPRPDCGTAWPSWCRTRACRRCRPS